MGDTIYTAPKADLAQPRAPGDYGSIERGLAGDYQIDFSAILREAWQRSAGARLPILVGGLIYLVLYMGLAFGVAAIQEAMGLINEKGEPVSMVAFGVTMLMQIVVGAVGAALGMGLFLMGVRRAMDAPITVANFFKPFALFVPMLVTAALMQVLVFAGFIALIIPGIYLAIAYYLALPLVLDKKLGPWQALETSRKALTRHWWGTFGLFFGIGLLNMLGALALLVGLLVTIPMSMIAFGIFYRDVFGVEPATIAD